MQLDFSGRVAIVTGASRGIGKAIALALAGSGAAVVALARERIAPTVSLYVNEWNLPARAAYARVGFVETTKLSTLMF